jgi:hypothetical protein
MQCSLLIAQQVLLKKMPFLLIDKNEYGGILLRSQGQGANELCN